MIELSLDYWNKLAEQTILICSFLGGFSIAITANLLINQSSGRLYNSILKFATVSSGSFLVTVFALTNVLMKTTEGYPFPVDQDDLFVPRIGIMIGYVLGIISLLSVIGLSGWTKSKSTGIFTTSVSIITFFAMMIFM